MYKIGVFFGGQSTEHEVSCISANQAMHALDRNKYEVVPVYISRDKDFYTGDKLFDLTNYHDLKQLCASLTRVHMIKEGKSCLLRPADSGLFKKKDIAIDVAFLVMHGTGGEDGTLQGMMEMMDIPYTSSNVLGSAVGQDKEMMKEILAFNNIPITPFFTVYGSDFESLKDEYKKRAKEMGYPLIVKPANLGSSIGIEAIRTEEEFESKVEEALHYDFKVIVEKMILNLKECNCSVMGDASKAQTSAIEEVMHKGSFLSFKEKYENGGKNGKCNKVKPLKTTGSKGMASLDRKVPADITPLQQETIEELALKSFKALNAQGVTRIDFMIDENDNKVYVNEINSIPGSLAFYLWREKGIGFDKECDELIRLAIKRQREKEKKIFTFDTNILKNYGGK